MKNKEYEVVVIVGGVEVKKTFLAENAKNAFEKAKKENFDARFVIKKWRKNQKSLILDDGES